MNSCELGWYVLGFMMPVFVSICVAILSGSFGELRQTDWSSTKQDRSGRTKR